MIEKVIEVKNLVKKYNNFAAVDNTSFDVYRGEVFGLIGENGAGKTTTLEIIEGLRQPTSGEVKVLGFDIKKHLREVKREIGIQLQSSAYYHYLKLDEIVDLFASFYDIEVDPVGLLKQVGLEAKRHEYVNNLSGGQKQRFSIVASLINDPEIVFLDEPTTGLDPISRRNLWDIISAIKKKGKTIILTTHYMEEAEILCDRIGIMDNGKIVAIDETHELIKHAKHPIKVKFVTKGLKKDLEKFSVFGELDYVAGKEYHYELVLNKKSDLNKVLKEIDKYNPIDLTVSKASLEDVFIELTGRNIMEEESV
ncbi:MAG: ABC transporter ATP-binding protein [Patescibacteria group bacterium]|nr:ABC transporter ATP-binding protein [Patescibacteria group bacterium]